MSAIWRGSWATRLRIATGLILFSYVITHFLIIGLGLFSSDIAHDVQDARKLLTRSGVGLILLPTTLLVHMGLALYGIAMRNTLRMPPWEAAQIALGVFIPVLLIAHIVYTRVAASHFGVNDELAYLVGLIFGTPDAWLQSGLLLIVWAHSCIGLHFWLRNTTWWSKAVPYLIAVVTIVPAFALAGFLTEGRRVRAAFEDPELRAQMLESFNFPDAAAFAALNRVEVAITWTFWILLALVVAVFALRKYARRRRSVRIRYVDGPEISAAKGPTLLEISRASGVPHTSLCGGRGRCTTCRVMVEKGAENLHPPSAAERKSLAAVRAPAGQRLACQIRPTHPMTVYRVFRPDGKMKRAHSSQGQERRMAVLFLDIRGFTARTTGQLPYDVVFLLNRFFDAIVPAITGASGTVDKYLGDGLLALFESKDEAKSARNALKAAQAIGEALVRFNQGLVGEGLEPVRIGIGIHLGDLVLGEIGAAGNAPRTIIGETVNAASRLEAMTKDMGVELLVSAPLLLGAGVDTVDLELHTLNLRGVRQPLPALAVSEAHRLDTQIGAI